MPNLTARHACERRRRRLPYRLSPSVDPGHTSPHDAPFPQGCHEQRVEQLLVITSMLSNASANRLPHTHDRRLRRSAAHDDCTKIPKVIVKPVSVREDLRFKHDHRVCRVVGVGIRRAYYPVRATCRAFTQPMLRSSRWRHALATRLPSDEGGGDSEVDHNNPFLVLAVTYSVIRLVGLGRNGVRMTSWPYRVSCRACKGEVLEGRSFCAGIPDTVSRRGNEVSRDTKLFSLTPPYRLSESHSVALIAVLKQQLRVRDVASRGRVHLHLQCYRVPDSILRSPM